MDIIYKARHNLSKLVMEWGEKQTMQVKYLLIYSTIFWNYTLYSMVLEVVVSMKMKETRHLERQFLSVREEQAHN